MADGYVLHIDGPLSLFSATNEVRAPDGDVPAGAVALRRFPPRRRAALGAEAGAADFHLESADGLISHYQDAGTYTPPELTAFVERFRQVAPAWEVSEATEVVELGREGVWVPDYRFVHRQTGTDVFVEVLGFWKRSSLDDCSDAPAPARAAALPAGDLREAQGGRGGPRRTVGADPPVQGDPQRHRDGRAARSVRREALL